MALPIVPRDLRSPPRYRTSTGVDRLKESSKAQMATNVPVGPKTVTRIASSVNASMWPKKRIRDSNAEHGHILRLRLADFAQPVTPRTDFTHKERVCPNESARPSPRLSKASRRPASIVMGCYGTRGNC